MPVAPPSESLGIHQSDIIIRKALVAAIAELRKDPSLLDHVFSSLARDEISAKEYGEKSVQKAKEWFLKTEIPVSMVPRIDEGKWPRITISLADSQETENTLGDVHYEPIQYVSDANIWTALCSPFTPTSFDPQLGTIGLPDSVELIVVPGMFVIDRQGGEHEVLEVDDDYVYIAENTIVDLRDAVIKGVKPMKAVHLESAVFRETYHIGVHVGNEPVYLTWLHSIIAFALLRYRETLLEARGFERSSIQSSDFIKNEQIDAELVFSRYITITGVVRNYWPKFIGSTINGVVLGAFRVNPADQLPVGPNDVNKADALWVGENDEVDLDSDGIG